MSTTQDAIKYGFNLYPFAGLVIVGTFLVQYGSPILQTAVPSLAQGSTAVRIILLMIFQLGGGTIALAGLFGALYKILQDVE